MDIKHLYSIEAIVGFLMVLIAYFISVRLVVLILLFLLALLNVCKAPTSTFWLVAVIVNEYSTIFIALTIITLSTGAQDGVCTLLGTVIGLIAVTLFFSPILRAYLISQSLSKDMKKAFTRDSNASINSQPFPSDESFNIGKLFRFVPKMPYRTYTYVTYDDTSLTLDFYPASVSGKRPCVVVIHGGSWRSGDSKQLPELNSRLASAGYHVAAICYRLVPRWQYPTPIEDTKAALDYLRNHADELNIDKENFVLLGRSAGGQIALLTAYKFKQLGIKGAINFYGPADMVWGYLTPTNPLVLDSYGVLERYIGGSYYGLEEKYRDSSPIEFVTDATVPTLMFHGGLDPLVFDEHNYRLSRKLKQHNVPHYFLQLPWATHGFDYHLNGPSGQLSTYAIEYFLHVVTNQ
ncbi:unnamed protein product [Adineta ricciae]|uniref:BD-FAE-like domain-containing protein n=1 Tax=Adineta ricciae TaxID=249248 RepID=A0A815V1B7_ADIRI|nr:unnamed protein product [Adineta ricciae]